jgi:CRP/FNR family transcriptional regulator, cyclic AMP receptor protein
VELLTTLKNIPLFSNLTPKNLKRVANLCKIREFEEHDFIVRQGDDGVGLFIITSGMVQVRKTTDEGREIDIATHGPGEFFGEISVLDGAPRTASVVAIEPTTCMAVVSWDFRALMDSHPRIALQIMPVLMTRFRETNEQLLSVKVEK